MALIAVARKVIVLDTKELPSLTLLGIAALIVALAIAFYLEKHARRMERANEHTPRSGSRGEASL